MMKTQINREETFYVNPKDKTTGLLKKEACNSNTPKTPHKKK